MNYHELHRNLIVSCINQKNLQPTETPAIEFALPGSFLALRQAITKILRDNNIEASEEEEEEKDGEKLKMMANAVMEIQKRIFMSKDP